LFSPAYSFNIFFRSIAQYTPADADVINEGEFEKHELHVIAHWRCASNIFLHILSFFLSFLLLNFLQDQPLFFLVNATLSVTSLHTYTEGNEDGFTDGNEDGNKDGFTDGNEDGNKDGITDGNKDGITDGNEVGHELHVIAHWRRASNIFLHILSFFLFLRNFLQDQPFFFFVNATLSVTSLHTYTEGNEDGFTDGNEDGNKDGFTDGNEDGNKDGITDGNKDGITDGNEVGTAVNVGVLECVTLGALLVGDEGILWLKLKLLSLGIDVGTLILVLMLLLSCTKRDLGLVKRRLSPTVGVSVNSSLSITLKSWISLFSKRGKVCAHSFGRISVSPS